MAGNSRAVTSADPKAKWRKAVQSFAKAKLRSESLYWKPRAEAEKAARTVRGLIRCAECQQEIKTTKPRLNPKTGEQIRHHKTGDLLTSKNYNLDHIEPVVPVGQEISLEEWIYRLLPPIEGWQVLCEPCHNIKTQHENYIRDIRKKIK